MRTAGILVAKNPDVSLACAKVQRTVNAPYRSELPGPDRVRAQPAHRPHNSLLAIRAPSAKASSFVDITCGYALHVLRLG